MARKSLSGFDAQNQKIINVGSASNPGDVPNWAQVQALGYGMAWKPSVRASATTNINLASPGTTIDGVTMAVGDRFLAPVQTDATQSGWYVWNGAASAATRPPDGVQGTFVDNSTLYVNEGTTNADKAFTCTNNGVITVGTTACAFAQVGGGTAYSNGYGVLLNGTVFSIDQTKIASKFAANVGDGSQTTWTIQHNLGTLDVIVVLYNAATGEVVDTDAGTGRTVNAFPLVFPSAPAANAYRAVVIG